MWRGRQRSSLSRMSFGDSRIVVNTGAHRHDLLLLCEICVVVARRVYYVMCVRCGVCVCVCMMRVFMLP